MVFFTCNHCGESVKKPSVEKHYNQNKCRGRAKSVSCMDCQKDFHGEDYVAHTKCITEAEKYSGKDYVHKESKNSGAKKQESWMDIIRSILDTAEYNLSGQARAAFQRLQSVDNVPRKKAKFQNFISNCMRMPPARAEEVWNVLERELEKIKLAKQLEVAATKAKQEAPKLTDEAQLENGKVTTLVNGDVTKKKSKKRKAAAETNGADENVESNAKKQKTENGALSEEEKQIDTLETEEFAWSVALQKIVGKHAEGIALEKLKKKIIKMYIKKLSLSCELTEKQRKKFDKKFTKNIKKCVDIRIENDIVKRS